MATFALKTMGICLIVLTGATIAGCGAEPAASMPADGPAHRVGIYNSRVVALAYGRSPEFEMWLGELRADHRRATEEGDTERAEQLEAKAVAQQKRIHTQVFSDAPIPDVIERIGERLAPIAAAAGVESIVAAGSYDGPPAEFVDVTDAMVALFDPSPKTLKHIAGLRKTKPVRDLDKLHDH